MQRQHGQVNDVEVAGDKDIFLELLFSSENGEILEGGIENRSSISLEFVEDKKTAKKLVGASLTT